MERSNREKSSPKEHITAIFEDYEASARVLQTLTNLSNTVIETALKGQCKFLFEIFQNADDAFDDPRKYKEIKLQFDLLDNYFIIQHNGKAFDFNDVERICDYASQIEEVKANDLSKTGYKGLGFKSLFNLTDCIYIHSNGYSFRFDKSYWSEPKKNPWHVIPIWCDSLPLNEKFTYDQPVNFIMEIKDKKQLDIQLNEVIDHPEVLLHLHRVNGIHLNINGTTYVLKRKIEKFGLFHKIVILKNEQVVSTWLSRTYERAISVELRKCIQEVSQFIFPDKIKNAKEAFFTFTLCTNEVLDEVLRINGICFSTLPTQLQLSLPYHVNSLFILNLDRTQLHENEWNEFLLHQIGYLQLKFLQDLAEIPFLNNYVIELLLRQINHPYSAFNKAFSQGFEEAKPQIAWLPAYKGCLLKLGEACIDKIHFFKQNFQTIQDKQCGYIIDYDVKSKNLLHKCEAKYFNYDSLFDQFTQKYYSELTENSYMKFLSYIHKISQKVCLGPSAHKLTVMQFLKTKNKTAISPTNALLEYEDNPIPDFAGLNPVDDNYFPEDDIDSFKDWLVHLGATRLDSPIKIIRESIFQWIKSYTLQKKMNCNNHKAIINYLAKNFRSFCYEERETLKKNLLILTKSNKFKIATKCYLPNAIALEELDEIMSDDELISSSYDIDSLKDFFSHLGIFESLSPIDVFQKCILTWIENGVISSKLTTKNYKPIIEFLSSEYQKVKNYLSVDEKKALGSIPVLTCSDEHFQSARYCYFNTVIPQVQGFEDAVEKYEIVDTQNLSDNTHEFLSSIGVSKCIKQVHIIRNSVLKWIQSNILESRINLSNHHGILKYLAKFWDSHSCELHTYEKENLKKLSVLTKSNIFREICACYWQPTCAYESDKEIPKLELIISDDELVSSEYYSHEKERPCKIEKLLNCLGVRHLKFVDIYDRYYDHLTDLETVEWFFLRLKKHWETYSSCANKGKLLNDLKEKLCSSHLLSKKGKMYSTTDIYSSYFLNMYNIDKNVVPVLAFEKLPKELEEWIGIKQKLELSCIMKLIEAIDMKQGLGEVTLTFYKTLLEQLPKINKTELRSNPLKLLSNDNKLIPATDLYYFTEEDSVCLAQFYLKRIHGMSHNETLKLAELCGVNLLEFSQEVDYGEEAPTCDKSLREFYLERLPLIALEESKTLYESSHVVLKKLFLKVSSINLHKCQNILIKYPFDKPAETRCYFDFLNIYVVGNWRNLRTKIHKHIKEMLDLKSDITEILDLESVSENKTELLYYQKEDPNKLTIIEEELNKLNSSQEITN